MHGIDMSDDDDDDYDYVDDNKHQQFMAVNAVNRMLCTNTHTYHKSFFLAFILRFDCI